MSEAGMDDLKRMFLESTSVKSRKFLKDMMDKELDKMDKSLRIATDMQDVFRIQGNIKRILWLLQLLQL